MAAGSRLTSQRLRNNGLANRNLFKLVDAFDCLVVAGNVTGGFDLRLVINSAYPDTFGSMSLENVC
ncbi:hypothetical protein T4D_17149 [Trichinella pseudospiralis]|uniref:Uncharacterized protein n=1 Tax=Trichinella pseudospiralis TaxID=6337 RepID=A0A0V1FFI8_TRIPS|nr:hypothetical protein T4D_17149 [Trichinella pseudospiralis]